MDNGRYGFRFHEPRVLEDGQNTIPLPTATYWLEVPQLAVYNEYELMEIGAPAEGYPGEINRSKMGKRTLVKWDLDTILEAFRRGFPISFTDKNDVLKLVDDIEEYLDKVGDILRSSNHDMYVFDDRLEDLDRLARSIYGNNKGRIFKDRQELIKQASLQSMFPDMILKELNIQPHSVTKPVRDYGNKVFGRYGSRTDEQLKENPLELVQSQMPEVDLGIATYHSRYLDPKEIRLKQEYQALKKG